MSVRVNLLPQETAEKQRANRSYMLLASGFGVLLLLVAATWWYMGTRVDDAEAELAAEQETLNALQADQAALSEFADLDERAEEAQLNLAIVLGSEVSVAGLLQDVAAVTPSDVELDNFQLVVNHEQEPTPGDVRLPIGLATMSGRTLNSHAPGVERFLLELDKLATLDDLFMSNSTLEDLATVDAEVVSFSLEADLGTEARTGRYDAGLPEVLR